MISRPHRVRPRTSPEDQALIDRALSEGKVTIVSPGHACGLTPMEQALGVAHRPSQTRPRTEEQRRAAELGAWKSALRRQGA